SYPIPAAPPVKKITLSFNNKPIGFCFWIFKQLTLSFQPALHFAKRTNLIAILVWNRKWVIPFYGH
ncbi:MAG: hypothetical protein WAT46_03610, partial [Saprospiraceae bacterium]